MDINQQKGEKPRGYKKNVPAGNVGLESIISVACKVCKMLLSAGAPPGLLKLDIVTAAPRVSESYYRTRTQMIAAGRKERRVKKQKAQLQSSSVVVLFSP